MAEFVITPEGRDALEAGTLIDDEGDCFVVLAFARGDDRVKVTFTPELFRDWAAHIGRLADMTKLEGYWADQ